MKSRILISISAITLLAALAMRPGLAAQEQQDDHHCRHEPKLIEFGSYGRRAQVTIRPPAHRLVAPKFSTTTTWERSWAPTRTRTSCRAGLPANSRRHYHPLRCSRCRPGVWPQRGHRRIQHQQPEPVPGQFQDPDYVFHGFVRFRDGSFDTFDAPGAGRGPGQGTFADSINREGTVAGYFLDENNVYRGFVRARDGTITQFEAPHAGKGKYQGTVVADGKGLNPEGQFRGGTPTGTMGFTATCALPTGLSPPIDAPGAYQFTLLGGINPAGATTGYYGDKNVVYHGLLRAPDGIFTTFRAPGAGKEPNQGTATFDLNPVGAITGIVIHASNVLHGFLRELCGKFTEFDARDAGTGPNQGTRPESINSTGELRDTTSTKTT